MKKPAYVPTCPCHEDSAEARNQRKHSVSPDNFISTYPMVLALNQPSRVLFRTDVSL